MRGTLIRLSSKNLSFDKNEVNPFLFRSSDMVLRVLLNMCLITMLTLLPAKNTILINLVRSY